MVNAWRVVADAVKIRDDVAAGDARRLRLVYSLLRGRPMWARKAS